MDLEKKIIKLKFIGITCIDFHFNKEYKVIGSSINSSFPGKTTYRFYDEKHVLRNLPLHSYKADFLPIYKETIISDNTTSSIEGLYSLQDIENILSKFDFDVKDLENVIKEFKKLTLKTKDNNEEKQEELEFKDQDDNLPF